MVVSIASTSSPPATARDASVAGPGRVGLDRFEANLEANLDAAAEKLQESSAKLVASALLLPMLNSMQNDPFRSDLLNGGMAEDTFRSMLNTRLADAIVQRNDFDLTEQISRPMMRWLQSQPPATVRRVAAMRIDILG